MRTRKDAKERTDGIEGILGQDREIACTEVPDITVNIIDIRRETGREREKGRGTEIETEEGIKGEERETGTERRKGIEIVTGTETRRENETEEKKDQGMRERDGKGVLVKNTTPRRPLPKPKKKERSLDQELLCRRGVAYCTFNFTDACYN